MILLFGGTYCIALKDQAEALQHILRSNPKLGCSLKKYTGDLYKQCNKELRSSSQSCDSQIVKINNDIIEILNKLPAFTPSQYKIIYRGISRKLNDTVTDLGFVSTSTEIGTAMAFAENIMRIVLLKDVQYKLIPVKNYSNHEHENEVILQPGCKFTKLEGVCPYKHIIKQNGEEDKTYSITTYICYPPNYNITIKDDIKDIKNFLETVKDLEVLKESCKINQKKIITDEQLSDFIDMAIEDTTCFDNLDKEEHTICEYLANLKIHLKEHCIEIDEDQLNKKLNEKLKEKINLK
jgi:hypothetical protein